MITCRIAAPKMAAILFIRYNYEVLLYLYISHFITAFLSSFAGSIYGRYDRGSICKS